MSILSELLDEIDAFLGVTAMAETTFGRQAANDGKLMIRLRGSKGVTTRTVEKLRDFMAANAPANTPSGPQGSPQVLERIAGALERLAPPALAGDGLKDGDAFVWHAEDMRLEAIADVNRVESFLL